MEKYKNFSIKEAKNNDAPSLITKNEKYIRSILGPLLSIISIIIYINLYNVSNILQPIMFADNTNLFSSFSNIKDLFNNANLELNKIAVWFKANKLSLNERKTKHRFFHKFCQKDNILLKLPILAINGNVIKCGTSIKLLSILLDEHFSWKNQISVAKNKPSKNKKRLEFYIKPKIFSVRMA